MKLVFNIFLKDIKGLAKNFFALVVAGALCIIPSLYAWFNIYSNWDPYANTGEISVAVFSEDKGYSSDDTDYVNMGDEVVDSLHDNKKINWIFCNSKDEALDGVYSGKYYASIIFGEDFSYSLYDFLANGMNHPTVDYYENDKKNAVAVKITDSARSTLQDTINTEFISVVAKTVLDGLNRLNEEDPEAFSTLISNLTSARDNLSDYSETVGTFKECNDSLSSSLSAMSALIPELKDTLNESADTAKVASDSVSSAADSVSNKLDQLFEDMKVLTKDVSLDLTDAENKIETDAGAAEKQLENAQNSMDTMQSTSNDMKTTIEALQQSGVMDDPAVTAAVIAQLEAATITQQELQNLISQCTELAQQTSELTKDGSVLVKAKIQILKNLIELCNGKLEDSLSVYTGIADTSLNALKNSMMVSAASAQVSLTSFADSMDSVAQILDTTSRIISQSNTSLDYTDDSIASIIGKLDTIISILDNVGDSQAYKMLENLMGADPDSYAEFMSQPVKISQIDVYPSVNYGTAVTPFYTALALWVGGIILVAIIKVYVDNNKEAKNAKDSQLYLGRLILFLVMGQIQAIIVALGNLYLLGIQCIHPKVYVMTCCITSFVFILIIYTLVVSFADVGKTIAVIMVVIQIAGSSGTYPIEILPSFFQNVYLYFPFPYAINAMREAISGFYEMDYFVYMGKLMIFAVLALLLGLVIRKPFIELNNFFKKEMNDTEMM